MRATAPHTAPHTPPHSSMGCRDTPTPRCEVLSPTDTGHLSPTDTGSPLPGRSPALGQRTGVRDRWPVTARGLSHLWPPFRPGAAAVWPFQTVGSSGGQSAGRLAVARAVHPQATKATRGQCTVSRWPGDWPWLWSQPAGHVKHCRPEEAMGSTAGPHNVTNCYNEQWL